jgi:hypothetical protein
VDARHTRATKTGARDDRWMSEVTLVGRPTYDVAALLLRRSRASGRSRGPARIGLSTVISRIRPRAWSPRKRAPPHPEPHAGDPNRSMPPSVPSSRIGARTSPGKPGDVDAGEARPRQAGRPASRKGLIGHHSAPVDDDLAPSRVVAANPRSVKASAANQPRPALTEQRVEVDDRLEQRAHHPPHPPGVLGERGELARSQR